MNFPKAFIEELRINSNVDADALVMAIAQQEEVVSIRINDEKVALNNKLNSVPWCSEGFYLQQRPSFTLDPLFHAGAYYVQEASSMFLEQAILQTGLDKKPCRVLDLCAAPGGKSTHLISLLNDDSLLVANEVIRTRTPVLAENVGKWGKTNYIVTSNDAKDFNKLENYFDAIVCDAPCSGEGLFRKDANAMNEWSLENVLHCAQRQKRIVTDIWSSLKPGGYFMYSTCTFNKNENEENVKWICENLNAEVITVKLNPEWGIVDNSYGYHFYPHKIKGEGFFISVMQKKKNGVSEFSAPRHSGGNFLQANAKYNRSKNKKGLIKLSAKEIVFVNHLISKHLQFVFYNENNRITIFPEIFEADLQLLKSNLRIISFGVEIAELKGKDILPQQSLANSLFLNEHAFEKINLNLVDSLRYLKGETNFNLNGENGWVLMCYFHPVIQKSFPIGFAKKIGNRINNHYPKNRMIRMQPDYEKIKASGEEAFTYPFAQ